MRTRIQEHDFDFSKKQITQSSPNPNIYSGIGILCSFVLVFSAMLLSDHNYPLFKKDQPTTIKNTTLRDISKKDFDFKSLNSNAILSTQDSIKEIFSLNSSFYPDHASVRIGIIDNQLDKVQGALLKSMTQNLDFQNLKEPVSISSVPQSISITGFDSTTKSMTFEVKYNLTVQTNEKGNVFNSIKTTHNSKHIQVFFNSHTKIEDIKLISNT